MKIPSQFSKRIPRPKILIPVAIAVIGTGVWLAFSGTSTPEKTVSAFYKIERGPFTINLPTGGSLEAVDQVTVRNLVPGKTEIISLIKEGTIVKRGDLLVELDATGIEDQLSLTEVAYQQSLFAFSEQEERFDVLKSENTVRLRAAELAADLAVQDLKKYNDGQWPQLKKKSESSISLATEELRRAQERLEGTMRLEKKGYATATELVTDTLAVKRREIELQTATEEGRLLVEFDSPRTLKILNAAVENTATALERTIRQNAMQIEKAQMQLNSAKDTLALRKSKLEELRTSLASTKIYAPKSGLVVYEKSTDWRQEPIAEGSEIRERQNLLSLPDISQMKVSINIYENQISLVKPGMRSYVHLDALPDQRFEGEVLGIAPMPEPARDGNPNFRVYKAEVLVKDKLPEIKPGITARVDVLVAELQDVIKVPLQAVVGVENRQFCFVSRAGKVEPVEVTVGLFDNDFVQITSGLETGDLVTLAPPRSTEIPAAEKTPDVTEPVAPEKNTLAEARKVADPS